MGLLNKIIEANMSDENITKAYHYLKDYCIENNIDMMEFISKKENIANAAETIHGKLGFMQRKIVSIDDIKDVLNEQYEFIVVKTQEIYAAENTQKIKLT